MSIQPREKYNQNKVNHLADYVRLYHDKGQPFDYEIIVDGFKAVRRTSDPDMFCLFENFINADTKSMEILFYTGSSNNNDKHIFYFGDKAEDELGGIAERKNELEELRQKTEEQQALIQKLEKEKQDWLASQSPLRGVLGEVGSSLIESFFRRNPNVLKGIPGGEALAGLLESDDKRKTPEDQSPPPQVSFQAKSDNDATNTTTLSEEDAAAISFVHQLKAQFTKEEFARIMIILKELALDKAKIERVVSQVTENNINKT